MEPPGARTAPLPPDVAAARRKRVNSEMLELLRRPAENTDTNSYHFQGMGLYTHVARPAPAPATSPRSGHARSQLDFLPLGGPSEDRNRPNMQGEVPEDIRAIYRDLGASLDHERELLSRGISHDPRKKYGVFDPQGPPPPTPRDDTVMRDDVNQTAGVGNEGSRRNSRVGSTGTGATIPGGTSTYDSSRDPRRRGR